MTQRSRSIVIALVGPLLLGLTGMPLWAAGESGTRPYTAQVISRRGVPLQTALTYANSRRVGIPQCGIGYSSIVVRDARDLRGIAYQYGVPLYQLMRANHVYSTTLRRGQRLCVPRRAGLRSRRVGYPGSLYVPAYPGP